MRFLFIPRARLGSRRFGTLLLEHELPISFPRDGGVVRFRVPNAAMHDRIACLLPRNSARPDTEAVR